MAIRARAQGVLLASCFDPAALDALRELAGKSVEVGVTATGDVAAIVTTTGAGSGASSSANGSSAARKLKLEKPASVTSGAKGGGSWVLQESEFASGSVGGKALNLAALRGKLPSDVAMPSSVAFPFGTFERVLADPANAIAAAEIAAAEKELAAVAEGSGIPPMLRVLRNTIRTQLIAPPALVTAAATAAEAAGLISKGDWADSSSPAWVETWAAVSQVWASKWNDRAWLSRRAQGVADADLYMSVLLQEVIPANYAFVLHTADPITGEAGKLHGEAVLGMGEALVGNYPGRALSFTAGGGGSSSVVEISAFPSKRIALRAEIPESGHLLIARSDSNGEDLEEFAGAGLYSSIPLTPLRVTGAKYADEPLLWDESARQEVLGRLAAVGAAVEKACGSPQDVEGVVDAQGNVAVVQARPQVIHS